MVQEPQTQDLRVELFDWDRINAKELLTINLLKGFKDTLGSKTLMGRSALSSFQLLPFKLPEVAFRAYRCCLSSFQSVLQSLLGVWSCDF